MAKKMEMQKNHSQIQQNQNILNIRCLITTEV